MPFRQTKQQNNRMALRLGSASPKLAYQQRNFVLCCCRRDDATVLYSVLSLECLPVFSNKGLNYQLVGQWATEEGAREKLPTDFPPPVIVCGMGGSGTRLIVNVLRSAGRTAKLQAKLQGR